MTVFSKAVTPRGCVAVLMFLGVFTGLGLSVYGQDSDRCRLRENNTISRCEVIDGGDPMKFFKGTDEPPEDWNLPDFVLGIDWMDGGNPIGYGEDRLNFESELTDMAGGYWSVFTRVWFDVDNLSRIRTLRFTIRHDDGVALYLNGTEIGRANLPNGPLKVDTPATDHEFTDRSFSRSFTDVSATPLVEGRNLVAVRIHNNTLKSSDAVLDLGVRLEIDITERPTFVRGSDCDGAPALDIGDPVYLLRSQFGGLYPEPKCMSSCDCNDDGRLDLSDAVYALNYLFQNGDPFPAPYPAKGEDRTPDDLTCGG